MRRVDLGAGRMVRTTSNEGRRFARPSPAHVVVALLLVGIAAQTWQLGKSAARLLQSAAGDATGPAAPAAPARSEVAGLEGVSLLFGAPAGRESPLQHEGAETRWTLVGTIVADGGSPSVALLRAQDGGGFLARAGDRLDPATTVAGVEPHRAVLLRGRRTVVLELPRRALQASTGALRPQQALLRPGPEQQAPWPDRANPEHRALVLGTYRLLGGSEEVTVSTGGTGWRVRGAALPEVDLASARLGVSRDDVIVRIDGVAVRGQGALGTAARRLAEGQPVELEVERRGVRQTIAASLR